MPTGAIELLVLAAIAVFLLVKLKNVLGTKTGFEKPEEYLRPVESASALGADSPVDAPAPAVYDADDNAGEALAAMRAAEPDFDPAEFLSGARKAYEMILMAFEGGDKQTLRRFLDDDVYRDFEAVIDERNAQNLTVEAKFVGVREASITAARFDPETREAEVDIRYVGELITAVRDSEHRIVEGDPADIRRERDLWTFGREMGAADPNWRLIATGE